MAVKVKCKTNFFNVSLKRSAGQYLQFEITASGAVPTFVYQAPNGDLIFQSSQFPGHPKESYVRKWPRSGDEDPPQSGVHILNFGFLGAVKYGLLVTQRDANATVLKVIKDCDYERENQTDMFAELFRIKLS